MQLELNKILELFNKLNDQTRYAIFGGVVFLIILVDVFFLVLPQLGGIASLNDQLKKISKDTQEVLTDRQRIDQLKKNLEAAKGQLGAISDKVRPIQEVPVILSTISSIANQYDVKIDQMVPEKAQQESLMSTPDGKYYGLPVIFKAHGAYHMFGHFLNRLENENLYFILKDFIIENDDKDTNIHAFSMTIKMILVDRSSATAKSL